MENSVERSYMCLHADIFLYRFRHSNIFSYYNIVLVIIGGLDLLSLFEWSSHVLPVHTWIVSKTLLFPPTEQKHIY